MQLSLRTLFLVVTSFAVFIGLHQNYPTLATSVMLLAPLPLLLCAAIMRRIRIDRCFRILIVPMVGILFYAGLLGPCAALLALPDRWKPIKDRAAMLNFMRTMYVADYWEPYMPESAMMKVGEYQEGWAEWARPSIGLPMQ